MRVQFSRSAAAPAEGAAPVGDLVRNAVASGGRPLDADVRIDAERRLGHDLRDVRLHTGGPADASARAVGALAYTTDSHIVFRRGQYAPDTATGRRTLLHELVHVVQQRSGQVAGTATAGGVRLSDPGDSFELVAARVAADPASTASPPRSAASPVPLPGSGGRDPAAGAPGGSGPTVQRCGATDPDECGCHG